MSGMNFGGAGDIKIFCASASKKLARAIVDHLGLKLGNSVTTRFADGEINMKVYETVRGCDVFIIQATSPPVNDHLMELLIMTDAMRRSSAGRITVVVPYFGYARQDRRAQSHDPISAKLVADMITKAGANRILTMDLHAPQIQGFFNIPMDHLRGIFLFANYCKEYFEDLSDIVVVSPDLGSVSRCNVFANILDVPLAIVDKRRPKDNESEVAHFIGDVNGKYAVLIDDQIASGGSLANAATTLMEHGAKGVMACVTHPVLCGDATTRIQDSYLDKLLVLDTIYVPYTKQQECPKIEVLSVAPFFGDAIRCIHTSQSIGDLFSRIGGSDREEG